MTKKVRLGGQSVLTLAEKEFFGQCQDRQWPEKTFLSKVSPDFGQKSPFRWPDGPDFGQKSLF